VPVSRATWYFAHVVAALAVLVFVEMTFLNLQYMKSRAVLEISALERVLVSLGVLAALWLWGWMLTDYFRNRPSQHAVAWGWFLVFGNWLAAIIYFAVVWRTRQLRAMVAKR
jgi:hypothetical protein